MDLSPFHGNVVRGVDAVNDDVVAGKSCRLALMDGCVELVVFRGEVSSESTVVATVDVVGIAVVVITRCVDVCVVEGGEGAETNYIK